MLYELKLRMYKAKLHIPKKDYKLFSTTQFLYTPESQESSNQTYMSSRDETQKQKDTNLQFQTHSTTSQELTKHDKFEKDNETTEEGCKPQDDNDSGYHTPTSPASTIAPVLKCPPAPKRLKWVRYIKRKGRIGIARRQILVPDEQIISLFGCEIEAGPMCKKARRQHK